MGQLRFPRRLRGSPAGLGVIASITRCKIVWKWLRDMSSDAAAAVTVWVCASTDLIAS